MSSPSQTAQSDQLIHCLAKNADLITSLDNTELSKDELAGQLGVSVKTVYRKTRRLREEGIVIRSSDGYELTNFGHLCARICEDVHHFSSRIADMKSLLDGISDEALPPYRVFVDGSMEMATPSSPTKPLESIRKVISGSAKLKAFSPVLLPCFFEEERPQHGFKNTFQEFIVSQEGVRHLETQRTESVGDVPSDGTVVYQSRVKLPYSLFLISQPKPLVTIAFSNHMGTINSILQNQTENGLEWGKQIFEHHKANSDSI